MIRKIWDHLEEGFLVPSLIFSSILLFVQVVMRYVFQNSLSWSEELARFLYIWEVWLGISYAAKNSSHFRVTLIFSVVKGKAEFILNMAVHIVWMAFGIYFTYIGVNTVLGIAKYGQLSSAMRIPMWIPYMGIPLGAGLMSVRLLENMIHMIKEARQKGEEV